MVKRISKVEFTLTSEDDQMALLASYLNRKDKLLDERSTTTTTKASSEIKKKVKGRPEVN